MPKGSDESWATKLYDKHLKKHKNFDKPRTSNVAFIIRHFADNVEYQVVDFVSKNRDSVNQEQVSILCGSKFDLVAKLFQEKKQKQQPKAAKPGARSKNFKSTVGKQFSESLKVWCQNYGLKLVLLHFRSFPEILIFRRKLSILTKFRSFTVISIF